MQYEGRGTRVPEGGVAETGTGIGLHDVRLDRQYVLNLP
jgi:hypothetical protein